MAPPPSSLRRTVLIVTLVLGVFLASASGQQRANAGSSTPRFKSGVDLVSLDLCVREPSGRFVPDLSAEDFVVFENGRVQRTSFLVPSGAVPLTAVLLIDVSSSMYGDKLKRALDAARRFAQLLGPDDRLAILAFNGRAQLIHGFGDDPALVTRALSSSIGSILASGDVATSSTALYDALLVAASEITRARGGSPPETREVIVLLSDGEDTSSRVNFEEVLPVVRRSGALVYSVSLHANARGEWLGATWPLLTLAKDTGARALGVPSLEALPDLYQEIVTEVRHLYRLAYVSDDTRADGQWRTVSVRVPSRDVRIRTRSGYYAPRQVRAALATSP